MPGPFIHNREATHMTVRSGREFLAIPGPTPVPDEVLGAMHRPAIEIYSGALVDVTETCTADLGRVFATAGEIYIYAANGHGAWEAALVNVLSRGDKVLALESGRFALDWGDMAAMIGVDVEALPGDLRRAVDPAALEARLRAELHELDVPALTERAIKAGVDYAKVRAACSCPTAKVTLTELLVERQSVLEVKSLLARRRSTCPPTKWRMNKTLAL